MTKLFRLFSLVLLIALSACGTNGQTNPTERKDNSVKLIAPQGKAIAAFAEGCFWCSEHIFEAVVGVDSAVSGYAGGDAINPTYELVNTETTGHAETVLVYYNPKVITYKELVDVFFASHDPTTPDQQGPDRGSSYRSVLFYQNDEERTIAMNAIREISASDRFKNPLVTELAQLKAFYKAEEYHQDYITAGKGSGNPYVTSVSLPRYEKFKKEYKGKLKDHN